MVIGRHSHTKVAGERNGKSEDHAFSLQSTCFCFIFLFQSRACDGMRFSIRIRWPLVQTKAGERERERDKQRVQHLAGLLHLASIETYFWKLENPCLVKCSHKRKILQTPCFRLATPTCTQCSWPDMLVVFSAKKCQQPHASQMRKYCTNKEYWPYWPCFCIALTTEENASCWGLLRCASLGVGIFFSNSV